MAKIKITLTQSNEEISRLMAAASRKRIVVAIEKVIPELREYLKSEVRIAILASPTWISLQGNDPQGLDAHFGIRSGELSSRLNTILEAWLAEIDVQLVKPVKTKDGFRTGIRFLAIDASWANVANLEAGVTHNRNKKTKKEQKLEWLKWLIGLEEPESPQYEIEGYKIEFGSFDRSSRSGKAVMRLGEPTWTLPADAGFANPDNNFVTAAMQTIANRPVKFMTFVFSKLKNAL